MTVVLMVPALAVTACFAVVWFGIAETPPVASGRLDLRGFAVVTVAISLVMTGLILVRLDGPGSFAPWLFLVLGLLAFWPFARVELATDEPLGRSEIRQLQHALCVVGCGHDVRVDGEMGPKTGAGIARYLDRSYANDPTYRPLDDQFYKSMQSANGVILERYLPGAHPAAPAPVTPPPAAEPATAENPFKITIQGLKNQGP